MQRKLQNSPTPTAADAETALRKLQNPKQREVLLRFFKTGSGEYGEGDEFWGLKVPQTREVARRFTQLPIAECECLLQSPVHEVRLCALLVWDAQMQRALPSRRVPEGEKAVRDALCAAYLRNLERCNNWDLIDLSAPYILGAWLRTEPLSQRRLLDTLAVSENLWRRRAAVVATLALVRAGQTADTLHIVDLLLTDTSDLIHKAMGWLLREVGKHDGAALSAYLETHYRRMPRTTLRYAVERYAEAERRAWILRK